jgi:hypothetical protein
MGLTNRGENDMAKRIETHIFTAPGNWRFILKLSRSANGLTVEHNRAVVERRPYKWAPSGTDALAGAVYANNPERAACYLQYLFNRDDINAAWSSAKLAD